MSSEDMVTENGWTDHPFSITMSWIDGWMDDLLLAMHKNQAGSVYFFLSAC